MMSPEIAKQRLKEFRRSDPEKAAREALDRLPPRLRDIASGLVQLKRRSDWQSIQEKALEKLDGLPSHDRDRLFRAFLPGLADVTERAWNLLTLLPYQNSYQQMPFRAPHTRITSLPSRGRWLDQFYRTVLPYPEQDVRWLAAYAPYLDTYFAGDLGVLLAAAIDANDARGDEVFEILVASANGTHETGAMGRHVVTGLLTASRPDGWGVIEKLLLAAQRQEGLRQVVLESVHLAHASAFRRMVRLMREQNMMRFSAALRAVGVWLGFGWDVSHAKEASAYLDRIDRMLEDGAVRENAIRSGDAHDCFAGLWCSAFGDAVAAVEPAARVLHDADPERRLVAAALLGSLGLQESQRQLVGALEDPDLRVAFCALRAMPSRSDGEGPDLFPVFERLLARCPKERKELEIGFWPWARIVVDRQELAGRLPHHLRKRSPKTLLPYLSSMDTYSRAHTVKVLTGKRDETSGGLPVDLEEMFSSLGGFVANVSSLIGFGKREEKPKPEKPIEDPDIRETLLVLAGDPSETVRTEAFAALGRCTLTAAEAIRMESLLTRRASDLRAALIHMLSRQGDEASADSASRLLAAKHELQRAAGLELAQIVAKAGRCEFRCRALIEQHQAGAGRTVTSGPAPTVPGGPEPTLENGLGLYDPAERTPARVPRVVPGVALVTPAAKRVLSSLDAWIEQHKQAEYVSAHSWERDEKVLLGGESFGLARPNAALSAEDDAANLQLRELWETWWGQLPPDHFDADGGAVIRAITHLVRETPRNAWGGWEKGKSSPWQYPLIVKSVLEWMLKLHPPENGAEICLDGLATDLAERREQTGWRNKDSMFNWIQATRFFRDQAPHLWRAKHDARLFEMLRWVDQPYPDAARHFPEMREVCAASAAGAATKADLYDLLVGPRSPREKWVYSHSFNDFQTVTGRRDHPLFRSCPALQEVVGNCRRRIVEIETARGEMETPVTPLALGLRYSGGAETLFRLLTALGKGTLVRSEGWGRKDRSVALSHLIRATYPGDSDTPEAFAGAARVAKLAAQRLLDLAMFAPHWARHVGAALDWPDLEEAVWWVHAHTKDDRWAVDQEIREAWAAEVNLRTPLDAASLVDGAVDVEWFRRIHSSMSADRWQTLDKSAKYASGGGGHKRAQLFADAMLGQVSAQALLQRMREKRHPDSVRAFGLVPLAEGEERDADLLARYHALQEFLRTGKEFGSMRQATEKLAVQIAMDNLARTAGYPDPLRLQWAMERRAIGDLAKGAVCVEAEDVVVRLQINPLGEAVLDACRAGKMLKCIPPTVKKLPEVKKLEARKREVLQQTRRMRAALEEAMVRGDVFHGTELATLMEHPVLARMLRSLVFVGDGLAGYLTDDGSRLESHSGSDMRIDSAAALRIAHPVDLLATGEWHLWQKECFLHERVQPFKQVFRELYVLTDQERADLTQSLRYAGHQVNPRQALAPLGKRGWIARPEEGVQRVHHRERIVASVVFDEYFTTPADVEGLTVQSVVFHRRGDWEPMKLEEVPKRLFSEVMRDVDLMVSVAHQGGVDPEASASTTEVRAALVQETCRLLKLPNVRCEGSHAKIEGKLARYSVHLGSAVVHTQPGGHLCIVPVHAQHRGRLFLPFVDDDPRTAEVVSKVLLLAKDTEIKDPIILEQILHRA